MEQTFCEEIDEILVKEEWVENEPESDIEDGGSKDRLVSIDPTAKCGEIFLQANGRRFTFICAICSNPFESLESFGQHVEFHLEILNALAVESRGQDPLPNPLLFSQLTQENDPLIDIVDIKREENCEDEPPCVDAKDKMYEKPDSHQNLGNSSQTKNNDNKKASKFPCPKCNRTYKYQTALETHVKKKHGEKQKQRSDCKFCDRSYRRIENLRHHVKIYHGAKCLDDEESTCRYCSKTFPTRSECTAHVKSEHPGTNKFSCPHCPRNFNCTTFLMYHIYSHTGEKPFKCKYCDKAFTNRWSLDRHIRIHLQIKNYRCTFCSKAFSTNYERKRHEETHKGENRQKCKDCGIRYRQKVKETLARH